MSRTFAWTSALAASKTLILGAAVALATLAAPPARAQGQQLNVYSARHYPSDEALYAEFTRRYGIKINRVDADDAGILARLASEGSSSPADVILLVDAARLWRAEIDGLFQPLKRASLAQRVPSGLRGKDDGQGSQWFGVSTRARVIVYAKSKVDAKDVARYEQLADPMHRGRVCTRSGSHPYNLSLFGSLLEQWGQERTQAWMRGMVSNMARAPKGGDTDQIRAVASGECAIAITNTYYLARLSRSDKPEDRTVMERVGVVFPDQTGAGTHINIAGAAVAKHAPHAETAARFIEYLVDDASQSAFADGNNEWPVVAGVKVDNAALIAFGTFKRQSIPVSVIGMNQTKVQQMLDRAGYR
jgi:iron(III) transport system substrate-binding protein